MDTKIFYFSLRGLLFDRFGYVIFTGDGNRCFIIQSVHVSLAMFPALVDRVERALF